jgi:formate--tetrahydrofolate ligase
MALKLGDYTVTEAGFGADLGALKFLDIKCRYAGLQPDAVVIVATVRALKNHGGASKTELTKPNLNALEKGLPNLHRHIENIRDVFGLPVVVAINKFPADSEEELALISKTCKEWGVPEALCDVCVKGSEGGVDLAHEVVKLCEKQSKLGHIYELSDSIEDKLNAVVRKIYRGEGVIMTPEAKRQAKLFTKLGYANLPVCLAKTQYSFSDNPNLLGAPTGFTITVRSLRISAGAGFIVALTGDIMTMPGLPKVPSSEKIDVDNNGKIYGLF